MGKFLKLFEKIDLKIRQPIFIGRKKSNVPSCRFVKERSIDFLRFEKDIRIDEI
jgi:hypothetical protein